MCTEDFIITLFCRVDEVLGDVRPHPQSRLYASEVVTLALLFALKGVGNRAFYRWLQRDWMHLFPKLPERTRLFRLFTQQRGWTDRFLAEPTILGIADTFGIELIHPRRQGRSSRQIGKKSLSNHRWIVGGKLAFIVNQWGLVTAWELATADVADNRFQPMIARFHERMIVFTDSTFHAAKGDVPNLKVCKRRTWKERIAIETVLSMLTTVCHAKRMAHRVWKYFQARLAYTLAVFNLLVQWRGLHPDRHGRIRLSIAEFGL